MFKQILYGFIGGFIICGLLWAFVGRSDIRAIRQSFDQVDKDFKGVQRAVSEVTANADGFATEISGISTTSRRIEDRGKSIGTRLTIIDGDVRFIAGKVDELESWNRQSIQLGRDLGDVAADIRRLNKESTIQK